MVGSVNQQSNGGSIALSTVAGAALGGAGSYYFLKSEPKVATDILKNYKPDTFESKGVKKDITLSDAESKAAKSITTALTDAGKIDENLKTEFAKYGFADEKATTTKVADYIKGAYSPESGITSKDAIQSLVDVDKAKLAPQATLIETAKTELGKATDEADKTAKQAALDKLIKEKQGIENGIKLNSAKLAVVNSADAEGNIAKSAVEKELKSGKLAEYLEKIGEGLKPLKGKLAKVKSVKNGIIGAAIGAGVFLIGSLAFGKKPEEVEAPTA